MQKQVQKLSLQLLTAVKTQGKQPEGSEWFLDATW